MTIVRRLNGLFAQILRCFPLQSVRIAAENRLVCGQKSSPIRRTLAMNPASKGYKKGAETDFIDLFLRPCRTRIDCRYSIIPQAGSQEKTLWYGLNLIDSANT